MKGNNERIVVFVLSPLSVGERPSKVSDLPPPPPLTGKVYLTQTERKKKLSHPLLLKNPKLKLPLKGGFLNLNPNPPLYRKQTGGGLGVKWGKGRRREVYPGLTLSPLPFFGSLSQFLSFSPPNAKMKGEDRQCNTFLRKDSHHRRFRPIKYKSRTTLRGKYGEGNCPLLFFFVEYNVHLPV